MAALALVAAACLLAGCGGATKTVTVSSVPANAPASAPPASTSEQAPPTSGSGVGGGATSTGASTTPSSTRTAPEPEFEHTETRTTPEATPGLAGALAVVQAHGYSALDASQYHPSQTLQVLIGTRPGASGATSEQAFFFVDGRYVGTDTAQPSAQISVVAQGDTEATLAYGLYRAGDSPCCPSGGQTQVQFQLNDGQLAAVGTIPPASSAHGLSRR